MSFSGSDRHHGLAMIFPVLPTLLAILFTGTTPAASPRLDLALSGFRSAEGQVLVAVYRGADGFPGAPGRAWKQLVTTVSGGRARLSLDLPPGEYAIAVVHDENANNTLDTSWIGIPREGIGASNNAKGRMGPPKYSDAKFEVGAAGATQSITIVYL